MEEEGNEQNQALAIRQIEMGTVSQTKKRSSVDGKAPKQKRSRRSNSQTMEFLIQLELDKENIAHEREEKQNHNAILMNLIFQEQ